MKEDICLTSYYYNKNKSLTLNQTHYYDINDYSKKTVIANETIDFPVYDTKNNTLSEIAIPDYIFIYDKANKSDDVEEEKIEKEKEGSACIIFGFKIMCDYRQFFCKNIPGYLKGKKITSSYNFNFIYHNEKQKKENDGYDAFLYIGEYPHEYNSKKYQDYNYVKTKATDWLMVPSWIFEFLNYFYTSNGTKISFSLTKDEYKIKGLFIFDLDIIIGTKDYFTQITTHYFNNHQNQCNINKIDYHYTVITCDKDFNTEGFPTLYFTQVEYNYTFELTHKDLFQVRGDKKYFLIIFDTYSNYPWKFGKIFMQKYFFNFDVDSRTIGFYKTLNNGDEDGKNKNESTSFKIVFLWIIWIGLLIITGVVCFLLGRMIYNNNRKKRANELDDDYDYKQNKI